MLRLVSVSIVALAISLGTPAFSTTNATLPSPVSTSLTNATTAADIAALVLANLDIAATIMAQAAALGIASPAQVLSAAISPSSSLETISTLGCAAAEAAPGQASLSAATAIFAAGGASWGGDLAPIIATAAIDCVEASGASPEAVALEAAEIVAVLQALAGPGSKHAIAQAAADATDTPDDSAASLQVASAQIEIDDALLDADPYADRPDFFFDPETTVIGGEDDGIGDDETPSNTPPFRRASERSPDQPEPQLS